MKNNDLTFPKDKKYRAGTFLPDTVGSSMINLQRLIFSKQLASITEIYGCYNENTINTKCVTTDDGNIKSIIVSP
jgi:hypothetical protein